MEISGSLERSEAELLKRLQFVSDTAEACQTVLDDLRAHRPACSAAIVLRSGDRTRAIGAGVPDERLRTVTVPGSEAEQRLRELIDSGEAGELGTRDAVSDLGFARTRSVPLSDSAGRPAGVLLIEEDQGEPIADAVADRIRGVGPMLARIFELEVQSDRLRRVQERSELVDTMVDSLTDPVILTDHQNHVLFANRRAEELLHAGPGESEGRRRAIRVNDLLVSSFLAQSLDPEDDPVSQELNLVDPTDGTDLLFEVISIPVASSMRSDAAMISVLRDITDLKRALTELEAQYDRSRVAERRARRESDQLNVIIGNAGDPILVTDEDSKIIMMNAEAERLFESSPDEAAGRGSSMRAVRANDAKFTTLMSDFLLQDAQKRVENLLLTDPTTSEELPVEVLSSKITGARGGVNAIVSIIHDLTQVVENERLARELQILNEGLEERIRLATEELEERNRRLEWQSRELQKASRLKSEFLASMSHELRTPINAMLGYTALMREQIYGELNQKQDEALTKIYGASQHLLALINDILDLSKIEAGRMPIRVEEVRLESIVSELAQTVEPMVREKELDFRTEVADDLPVMRTDRTKVKQILLNLLSNAVKFTEEGSVRMRAHPVDEGRRVRMEVSDTGIGISEDDLKTIFDDFRQVDQSNTRRFGGTGLGLSITRKLTSLMEGTIDVESTEGAGSRFIVELPVVLESDDASPGGTADTLQADDGSRAGV